MALGYFGKQVTYPQPRQCHPNLSKIENQKLSFGEFPSDELIIKLSRALGGDSDELLLLAEKIPDAIRKRVLQRPEAFRKIASLDDKQLDELMEFIAQGMG